MRAIVPERPRLAPWYRLAAVEGGLVFEYGGTVLRFGGRAAVRFLPALLPLLDGHRTVADVERALGESIGPAVEKALRLLAGAGLLTEGPAPAAAAPVARTSDFLAGGDPLRRSAEAHAKALRSARVAVVGLEPAADEAAVLLRRCGGLGVQRLGWEELSSENDLVVVAAAPSELPLLEAWNERAISLEVAWLQLLPFNGRFAGVGPLYVPNETCCYACFRLRVGSNSGYPEELPILDGSGSAGNGSPAVDAILAGLLASLALRWLAYRDPALPGRLFTLGFDDGPAIARHSVYRVPRCPVCSGLAATVDPLPWGEVRVRG